MAYKIKYLFSLLVILGLIAACSSDKSDKKTTGSQTEYKDTTKINKDQYRVAEIFNGNKNQIIDLIKGPASFEIQYMGSSHFKATLMTAEGKVIDVLAEVDGTYKGKKKVDIPETTAYILDVQCVGDWSVYRE